MKTTSPLNDRTTPDQSKLSGMIGDIAKSVPDKKLVMTPAQLIVTKEIIAERGRQEAKWGQQNHDPELWLAILGEEVGECNNAFLEMKFGNSKKLSDLRGELIQVAAVAMSFVECIDRRQENDAKKKLINNFTKDKSL